MVVAETEVCKTLIFAHVSSGRPLQSVCVDFMEGGVGGGEVGVDGAEVSSELHTNLCRSSGEEEEGTKYEIGQAGADRSGAEAEWCWQVTGSPHPPSQHPASTHLSGWVLGAADVRKRLCFSSSSHG